MPALAKALMTAIYPVPDIRAAKAWYAGVFGVEPYFDGPLDAVKDGGGGIRVGLVTDPYGNALGLIENPHFTGKG